MKVAWLAGLPITVLAASAIAPDVSFLISASSPKRPSINLARSLRAEQYPYELSNIRANNPQAVDFFRERQTYYAFSCPERAFVTAFCKGIRRRLSPPPPIMAASLAS
jgi:hypothetical protein